MLAAAIAASMNESQPFTGQSTAVPASSPTKASGNASAGSAQLPFLEDFGSGTGDSNTHSSLHQRQNSGRRGSSAYDANPPVASAGSFVPYGPRGQTGGVSSAEIIEQTNNCINLLKEMIFACKSSRDLAGNEIAAEINQQLQSCQSSVVAAIERELTGNSEVKRHIFSCI